jgi:hypothetical protein
LIFGITASQGVLSPPYSSAILSPMGIAHPWKGTALPWFGVGSKIHRQIYDKPLPQRTNKLRNYILFDRF